VVRRSVAARLGAHRPEESARNKKQSIVRTLLPLFGLLTCGNFGCADKSSTGTDSTAADSTNATAPTSGDTSSTNGALPVQPGSTTVTPIPSVTETDGTLTMAPGTSNDTDS